MNTEHKRCGNELSCDLCSGDMTKHCAEQTPEISMIETAATHEITHLMSLSVMVNGGDQWLKIYELFGRILEDSRDEFPHMSVSTSLVDNEAGVEEHTEYYDENTMFKVREAVQRGVRLGYSTNDEVIDNIVDAMLNAGILFRERR